MIRERSVNLPLGARVARALLPATLVLLLSPGAARRPIRSSCRSTRGVARPRRCLPATRSSSRWSRPSPCAQNTLDLEVVSLNYEKAAFGIGSAKGYFDPFLEVDANANRTLSPDISRISATDTKNQNGNLIFGGNLQTGGTYTLGWYNQRVDSAIPGFTLFNPRYTSTLSIGATQPLLQNFGSTVSTRFIVQAKYQQETSAYNFVAGVQGAFS